MAILNQIYGRLPVALQNVAISAYGAYWNRRRYGGDFRVNIRRFHAREGFTAEQWISYQTEELRRLLVHACESVPYYARTLREAGHTVDALRRWELTDLGRLPMLEKDHLRRFGTNELLSRQRERRGEFYSSSGSTGTPTQILFSPRMHQTWSAGFEARIRNWAGVDYRTPRGMIGGRRILPGGEEKPPFYRYNLFEKQVYFSAYHISAGTAANYVEGMVRHAPAYMTGYAMSNYFLARFIEQAGLQAPPMRAVITSSEGLTPEMRATFQRVYRCRSYDSYSGVEACGLVSECPEGRLHISPDLGIIELIAADGRPAQPGEEGEVVCTGLLNHDQPLIRYRIGDLMRLATDQHCPCGRQMPVIAEIVGRVEDTIIGCDGREMVRFHGVFVGLPNIIEAQIVQHALTDIEARLVIAAKLTPSDEATIVQRIRSQLPNVKVRLTVVDSIPRNRNGKFRSVVSLLQRRTP